MQLDCEKNKTGLWKKIQLDCGKIKLDCEKNKTRLWKNKTGLWKIKVDCNQSRVYSGTAKSVKPSSSEGYSEGDDKYQACYQYVDVPAR